MTTCTITIADHTKAGIDLFTLLSQGTQGGYTVVPSGGINPAISLIGGVSYLSIQASYGNSTTVIYKGDENTANDGTRQGKELQNGDTDVIQAYPLSVNLREIYLRANGDNVKVNIEIHYA